MYGAGRLESRNVREYETAAHFARKCGHEELIDCLLSMAETEWEHEKYFRSRVLIHGLGRRLSLWPAPPAKDSIRLSFAKDAAQREIRGFMAANPWMKRDPLKSGLGTIPRRFT